MEMHGWIDGRYYEGVLGWLNMAMCNVMQWNLSRSAEGVDWFVTRPSNKTQRQINQNARLQHITQLTKSQIPNCHSKAVTFDIV